MKDNQIIISATVNFANHCKSEKDPTLMDRVTITTTPEIVDFMKKFADKQGLYQGNCFKPKWYTEGSLKISLKSKYNIEIKEAASGQLMEISHLYEGAEIKIMLTFSADNNAIYPAKILVLKNGEAPDTGSWDDFSNEEMPWL